MAKPKKGLTPKLFSGLNKERMKKGTGSFDRLRWEPNKINSVQFLTGIDGFIEYDLHRFREDTWKYVPCAGEDCPLCEDESSEVSKTTYRFACNVYHHGEKKVLVLEGPKDLANRIAPRYKSTVENANKKTWLKRVWDVTQMKTEPVSYDIERSEQRPINTSGMKPIDLEKYVSDQMAAYFGSATSSGKKDKGGSSLDDDWDEDDEWEDDDEEETWEDDEALTEEDLLALKPSELREVAEELGINMKGKKITKENRKKLIATIIRKQ